MKLGTYILVTLAFATMLAQAKRVEPSANAMGEKLENMPYEAVRFPIRKLSEEEMKAIGYLVESDKVLSEVWLPSLQEIEMLEFHLH